MKTLVKQGNYLRVENTEVDLKVKSGWKLCSKSEWKMNHRDIEKAAEKASEEEKRKSIEQRKLEKRNKNKK